MSSSGLPRAFFLDDPSDGASPAVLSACGVREEPAAAAAAAAAGACAWSPVRTPASALATLLSQEHSLSVRVRVCASLAPGAAAGGAGALAGAVVVDVRDPAGAWVRLLRLPGDAPLVIEVRAAAALRSP
jgi:hypothetical protein